jgi:cation:H+ antiporter
VEGAGRRVRGCPGPAGGRREGRGLSAGDLEGLLGGLAAVVLSAVAFTNAIEWAGRRLGMSQGALGSLLAALGTALPETVVAVLAVLQGGAHDAVGIGAILGAPLLLTTLASGITGAATLVLALRGRRPVVLKVDGAALDADLLFFAAAYALAAAAGLLQPQGVRLALAGVLVAAYALYVERVVARPAGAGEEETPRRLWLAPRAARPPGVSLALQLGLALALMLAGGDLFVHGIEAVARALGVSGFVVSVLATPVATELPEILSGVVWVGQGKDTLAVGNITGALALQSSLIPALGIVATPWRLQAPQLLAVAVALAAVLLVIGARRLRGRLSAVHLLAAGALYAVYVAVVLRP